jgi:hypothetical protein
MNNGPKGFDGEVARNHPRVLQTPVRACMTWGANADFRWLLSGGNPLTDVAVVWAMIKYIVSYMCKGGESTSEVQALYKDALAKYAEGNGDATHVQTLRHLANRALANMQLGHPQAVWHLQGLPLFECPGHLRRPLPMGGFTVLRPSGGVEEGDGGGAAPAEGVLDRYRREWDKGVCGDASAIAGIRSMCLYAFASGPAHLIAGPAAQPGGKPTKVPAKVGHFVPVVSGIGALRPPSAGGPSCATLANSVLRLFKPGRFWDGAVFEEREGGPGEAQIQELFAYEKETGDRVSTMVKLAADWIRLELAQDDEGAGKGSSARHQVCPAREPPALS